MEKIYERWVKDYAIDGFRIDTVKNVDMPFWTQWATALDSYAAKHGRKNFFLFGETYDADPSVTSPYVTQGRLDATLDFPFQDAARAYASQGAPPSKLAGVYGQDYRYTTDKANAYEEVTFLGNHDMGRIGSFLEQDNPKASDAELLRRDELANEVMFLGRGNPVIYYGDEQGFTGAPGGDKNARQTMFASKVADYLDDDEIGTDRTAASDAYDPTHPLYRAIAALSKLTKDNPALRDGVQTERYTAPGTDPGVYAYSRTDAATRDDYLVAVNNATTAQTVTVPTGNTAGAAYRALYGTDGQVTASGDQATVTLTVPPLQAVVYRAAEPLPKAATRPALTLTAPAQGATGTVEIGADATGGGLNRVVFAAQVGNAPWKVLGSADHAPYRVTQALDPKLPAGTPVRYKAVVVDDAGRTADATAATATGTVPVAPPPTAISRDYAIVHYQRTDGDYADWNLYTWGDIADGEGTTWPAGHPFTGRDAYGAFAYVKLKPGAANVGFIVVNKDGVKDTDGDRSIDLTATGEVWIKQGSPDVATTPPDGAYPPQDTSKAVLHYHRADGDYTGWGLHVWTGAANPTDWTSPIQPTRIDSYGAVFEVPLADGATSLSYIIHNGDTKDLPSDQSLDFASSGHEVWLLDGTEKYLLPQPKGSSADLDLGKSEAQWIDAGTVAWKTDAPSASQQLVYAPDGGITVQDGALSGEGRWLRLEQGRRRPHRRPVGQVPAVEGLFRLHRGPARPRPGTKDALRGQLIATQRAANGALLAATGVQTQGVLDDLYAGGGPARRARPGVQPTARPTLSVWAPTAHSVSVEIGGRTVAMRENPGSGVWSVRGHALAGPGRTYRYEVTVWAPSVQKLVVNKVTDPYSVALTADSKQSLLVDLADPKLAPKGWAGLRKPPAVPISRAQIQELHIRDFSVADTTVPAADRGKYPAFTDASSAGMTHLKAPGEGGLNYVHLLPAFDFATVPEKAVRPDHAGLRPGLATPPDSDQQQACVTAAAGHRRLQLGLRPVALHRARGLLRDDPDGAARTTEFRQMVQGLNEAGLRVVMDVVYNHTSAAGQADHLRARPDRARLLPAADARRLGGQLHLLRQHRARERDDGQAGRRLGRHLGQGVQGRRLPVRPDGPPPEGQHPRRPQGARRADRRQGRRRRQEDHPLRRGLELRRGRRQRPVRPGHPGRTWPAPASPPSPTGPATRCAAAAPSTPTPGSRASPPASTPTPTPPRPTARRPSRRPGCCTTRT